MSRFLVAICFMWTLVCCITPPIPALDPSNSICLGDLKADTYLIFLQGMDKVESSAGDQHLRSLFSRLASELNMRVAFPKAKMQCPTDPRFRCWGWDFGAAELKASSKIIRDAAATCFPQDVSFGLIGFSNGGYLVSKLYRNCQLESYLPKANFAVAIGATALRTPVRDVAMDLRDCGRFRILSGTKDSLNTNQDGSYIRLLQSHGGDAEEILFDGGHTLPEKELREMLHLLLNR